MALLFVVGLLLQAGALLSRNRRAAPALLAAGALAVCACAVRDADYTLLCGQLLLLPFGLRRTTS